ncbi:MAG: MFS transporter [Burkholderiales bacterium]|nr:MFS transporter [Burkholderiales bacterium]
MNNSKKILITVFITIFIDMLGIGVLIPVFPLLVTHGSEFYIIPNNWTQDQAYILSGWLLASYPLMQFIFSPILGQISDNIGRRKVLLVSILGTSLAYFYFGTSILQQSIIGLFIARIIDGISGGNISTAQAVIADVSKPEHRARNFGLIGVSIGVGFVFGPAIGGILSNPSIYSKFNAATPFWFAGILSLINCFLIWRNLPETLATKVNKQIEFKQSIINIGKLFKLGSLSSIIPVMFLYNFGWTFFTSFWGIVLVSKFGFNQLGVGGFFAYLGVMIIFAQGGVVRRLSGKVNEVVVLKISLIMSGICLILYYLVPSHVHYYLYIVTPFLAIGAALSKSFSSSLITRLAHKDELGVAMGVNSSANALAQAIPAIIAGYVAYFNPLFAVLLGGLIIVASWVIFNYTSKKIK